MARVKKRDSWKQYLQKIDNPFLKWSRRSSAIIFILFYALLLAGLGYGAKSFLDYCNESFIMYENSQLSLKVDEVMAQLNAADAEELKTLLSAEGPVGTQFDDADGVFTAKYETLAAAELTCRQQAGYDAKNYDYNLYADGGKVGTFSITAGEEEVRLGLLTITDWLYNGGQVDFTYDSFSRSYTVPEGFVVTVNGIQLDESHMSGEVVAIEDFAYIVDYVDMPGMVTYTIEGLLNEPETEIIDNLGASVEFDPSAPEVVLEARYTPSSMPEELELMAIETAKLWANYSLRDAELYEIQTVLIEGSLLYEQVEASNFDRRYIDRHTLIGYENEQIVEYTRYSDICFVCRVYMERTVQVESTGALVVDDLDNIFYFVYLDLTNDGVDNASWYIADMLVA